MRAIVTVRLARNEEHHSYIESGIDVNEIRKIAELRYKHVTRIEEIV